MGILINFPVKAALEYLRVFDGKRRHLCTKVRSLWDNRGFLIFIATMRLASDKHSETIGYLDRVNLLQQIEPFGSR